jgi:hypothetical protein
LCSVRSCRQVRDRAAPLRQLNDRSGRRCGGPGKEERDEPLARRVGGYCCGPRFSELLERARCVSGGRERDCAGRSADAETAARAVFVVVGSVGGFGVSGVSGVFGVFGGRSMRIGVGVRLRSAVVLTRAHADCTAGKGDVDGGQQPADQPERATIKHIPMSIARAASRRFAGCRLGGAGARYRTGAQEDRSDSGRDVTNCTNVRAARAVCAVGGVTTHKPHNGWSPGASFGRYRAPEPANSTFASQGRTDLFDW